MNLVKFNSINMYYDMHLLYKHATTKQGRHSLPSQNSNSSKAYYNATEDWITAISLDKSKLGLDVSFFFPSFALFFCRKATLD